MELKARQKATTQRNPAEPRQRRWEPQKKPDSYPYLLTIRCNTFLYNTIQNMLNVAHTAQDFTHTSIADVIRAALGKYQQGMRLTEMDEPGEKLMTTVRVDRGTRDFYAALPARMRTKILERALRTFLKQR
jgi:hypothetical protein